MSRLLLLDNYDSFTWNLAQSFMSQGAECRVVRNDCITVDEVLAWEPTHVCVSPGPGRPEDAGISMDLIRAVLGKLPLLGVCLGHQAMATATGGVVGYAPRLMHGMASPVFHDGKGMFDGLDNPMEVARYHSLIVDGDRAGEGMSVTSYTREGEVMGMRHDSGLAFGVQFHPESVLTPQGDALLANFLGVKP